MAVTHVMQCTSGCQKHQFHLSNLQAIILIFVLLLADEDTDLHNWLSTRRQPKHPTQQPAETASHSPPPPVIHYKGELLAYIAVYGHADRHPQNTVHVLEMQ